jgi:glycosyltransferase involved in cell wall biosynthesis
LRIVITVPHFPLDIGRNESGLGEGMAKLGHEATVIAAEIGGKKGAQAHRLVQQTNRPYHIEVVPSFPFTSLNPLPLGVRERLKALEPDVVHSSEDTDLLTVMTFKATRALKLPFILSTERYYVPKFPKSVGYRLVEAAWTQRIRREADAVTTHSTIQKAFWAARGLDRRDVEMIPVGVWTDRFSPGKSEFLRENFKIGPDALVGFTVGRMTPYKDYPTMMKAMRAVIDRDASVHLLVAGFGPKRDRIVGMARELGLGANVHFFNQKIAHAQMPEVLRSADFYLQTSSVEPFGISVVEAMAVGIPVVVTDVGGMSDTVEDGVVGLKVASGDSVALAERILQLRDPELRARLGGAGRARALERFDWLVVCKSYLGAYARGSRASAATGRTSANLAEYAGAQA